jgi:hypothetical protein
MSLNVTVFDTTLEIKINSRSLLEFSLDQAIIHSSFLRVDRVFDANRKVWVISNFQKYASLPMVAKAMESRKKQMELF